MLSTSFIRKSNGYCCIKKQMVLCTIFMQPFGLKIAWKSAVCHEKTVYEKNLPFLIQYRFISYYIFHYITGHTLLSCKRQK